MILCGSDPELIFLTDGASKGVMQILNCVIRGEGDGVIFVSTITESMLSSSSLESVLLLFCCVHGFVRFVFLVI